MHTRVLVESEAERLRGAEFLLTWRVPTGFFARGGSANRGREL